MLEHNPLVIKIKELASRDTVDQTDESMYALSGATYDDAYNVGTEDGKTFLAREILDTLGIGY